MEIRLIQQLSFDILRSIRLIATDMDGTLTQAGKFTPQLLQALTALQTANLPVLLITGRSAGWVNGLVHYLPVVGAIAENGGLFYPHSEAAPELLVPLSNIRDHRQQLAHQFEHLKSQFPQLQESIDNAFRITDWTFDVAGLSLQDLRTMEAMCHDRGWGFTYSNVQCHIKPSQQEKALGLLQVLQRYYPDCLPEQVITIGDSPNDESLFDRDRFPYAIGVANVKHYWQQLKHRPAYVTQGAEVTGFCEVAQVLQDSRR